MRQRLKFTVIAVALLCSAIRAQTDETGVPRTLLFGSDEGTLRFSITTDATRRTATGALSEVINGGEKIVWRQPLLRTPAWAMMHTARDGARFVVTFDKVQRSGVVDGLTIYDGVGGVVKDYRPQPDSAEELEAHREEAGDNANRFDRLIYSSRIDLQFFTIDPEGAPVLCVISRHRRTRRNQSAAVKPDWHSENLRRTYINLNTGELKALSFPDHEVRESKWPFIVPPELLAKEPLPGQILPDKKEPNPFGRSGAATDPTPSMVPVSPFTGSRPATKVEVEPPPYFEGVYRAVGDNNLYFLVRRGTDYYLYWLSPADPGGRLSLLQRGTQSLGRFQRFSTTELRADNGGRISMGRLTSADNSRSFIALSVGMPLNERNGFRLLLLPDEIQGMRR